MHAEAAVYLSCYCISDHMGICRYCWTAWTRVTKFGWHVYIEGFVHSLTAIWLGSLKCVLPEHQMTNAGEIIQATFEEVLPGPGDARTTYSIP